MSARIRRVKLEGFKGFRDATLEMGDFTVVVGTNASGKSNLRDAFRFLHGIGRGYTLAEIIGEKWGEGGVLQWKGLRGGTREAAFAGTNRFSIEATIEVPDSNRPRLLTYRVGVNLGETGRAPSLASELLLENDGLVFQAKIGDEHEYRFKATGDFTITLDQVSPTITQVTSGATELVAPLANVLSALRSMRFLDLSPDAMRIPSLPGQTVLGDRGENLSSVLQAICDDAEKKKALAAWLRQLTPLDVTDLDFVSDAAGRILVVLVETGGRRTSAYSASDGTLRFLSMIAAFLGPEPARFYFFEELDTGLHPTRLHLLLDLIERQTALGVSQVVATTHSPQLLSLLGATAMDNATLAYRLPSSQDQRLIKINRIPDAIRVLRSHDVTKLFSTGWLEDAVHLTSEDIPSEPTGVTTE